MAFGNANTGDTQAQATDSAPTNGKSYCDWAHLQFNAIDADVTKNSKGDKVKEFQANAVLNFMMTLGYQKQDDQGYATRCALPEEGEKYSQEELEHIKQFPTNYFKWVTDNRTGKKERKQFRPISPEQELVLAFDFNDIQIDYAQHPKSTLESDVKPLRIDWNGWFRPKEQFNTRVKNTILYGQKTISDKNPLYKIAKAGGVLEQYLASGDPKRGHDYSLLAGATVGLSCTATLREYNDKFYIEYRIKDPTAITDVKVGGKVVASKEDQISAAQVSIPFVGIEYDDKDFVYEKSDLECIRYEWKLVCARAKKYQPSAVKFPDFYIGTEWEDSTLYKALEKEGLLIGGSSDTPKQEAKQTVANAEEVKKQTPKKVEEPVYEETGMDFDDQIPF